MKRKKLLFTKLVSLVVIMSLVLATGCGKKEAKGKIDFESAIRNELAGIIDNDQATDTDETSMDSAVPSEEIPEMDGFDYIKLDKKGKIVNTITGEFDRDYYDEAQLETFLLSEVSDYNRDKGEDLIEVKSVHASGSEAKIVVSYKDVASFGEFNQQEFFYGTIGEAKATGYALNVDYIDKKGKEIHADEALKKEKRMIIISRSDRDRLNIITPKKILYTGGMAQFEKKNEAVAMPGGISIIILK